MTSSSKNLSTTTLVILLTCAGVVAVRFLLGPLLEGAFPFLLFFPAMALAFIYGTGAGLVTTLILLLSGTLLFVEPAGALYPQNPDDWRRIIFFAVLGLLLSIWGGRFLRNKQETHERRLMLQRVAQERERAEQRQRFMSDLAVATQRLETAGEVTRVSSRMLAEYLEVDRCAYAEIEIESDGSEVYVITGDFTRGVPSIVGRWPISAFGQECARCMLADEAFVVEDIESSPFVSEEDLAAYRATNIQAVICVPLQKGGVPSAAMAVHQTVPRQWSAAEIDLVFEVAERCWESLERTKALRRLQDSEARFRDLADNISQLVWMANADGHMFWFNQRWLDFTGTTLEKMVADGWIRYQHPAHRARVLAGAQRSLETGEPWEDTFPLRGKDGSYRWFLTHASPIRDEEGRIVRWFGTNTDISELRQLQDRLQSAATRLAAADQRKNEFLATLAHELRNPLAPIQTGLEIVKRAENLPPVVTDVHAMMARQTRQLVKLVDDLLDISRITRGRLELSRVRANLEEIIQIALETSRPLIDNAHQTLHVEMPSEPVWLEADPQRLAQVLSNLLNNATKYTPQEGSIWLQAERQGNRVLISVRDSGIGIPPDKLEYIFEMFSQVDRPLERGYTGLGIGLTLSRSLVQMHGGSLDVQSEGVDKGSTFTVVLPLGGEPAKTAADQPAADQPLSTISRRVLVVDDNMAAAETLSQLISMYGHEVRTAGDGLEALATAETFMPDIVIMDLGMPRMNGYEAAREMRAQPWGKKILLIALSGWGQDEDKRRTREVGFDHHHVKPMDLDALQRYLRQTGRQDRAS